MRQRGSKVEIDVVSWSTEINPFNERCPRERKAVWFILSLRLISVISCHKAMKCVIQKRVISLSTENIYLKLVEKERISIQRLAKKIASPYGCLDCYIK